MESFLRIVEKKIRPPFKYFIVEQGCFKAASSRGFNTLKEAKIQAEEWVLNDKRSYSIMKVFFNEDEDRLGYMGMRILTNVNAVSGTLRKTMKDSKFIIRKLDSDLSIFTPNIKAFLIDHFRL